MSKKHSIAIFVFGALLFFSLNGLRSGGAAELKGSLDTNQDGIVSTKEFGTAYPGYENSDVNMDGVVDHAEMETVHAERGIGNGYGHVDADKDGVMDHNEIESQHTAGLGKDDSKTTHVGKSDSAVGGSYGGKKSGMDGYSDRGKNHDGENGRGGRSGGSGNGGSGGHEGGGGNGGGGGHEGGGGRE
jgi:hypothetical protein